MKINKIQNCQTNFPAIEGLATPSVLNKVRIQNIYQRWQGESIAKIAEQAVDNPYSLRIGMPSIDTTLKNDAIYFILDYLSYNPLSKLIEKRQLTPLRNMEKIYIGQSIDEVEYKECLLNVNGSAVVSDLFFKNSSNLEHKSIANIISNLMQTVEQLKTEIADLKKYNSGRESTNIFINNE